LPYFIPNIAARLSEIDVINIDVITICLSKKNEINKKPIIKYVAPHKLVLSYFLITSDIKYLKIE
tara:strand:- start:136 stop:330 length:195 start_codon:yes stop_codon:yes gene_type:complete